MQTCDWSCIDMSGVEQGKESAFAAAIDALNDQPAVVAPGARSGGEHRLPGRDIGTEIKDLGLGR